MQQDFRKEAGIKHYLKLPDSESELCVDVKYELGGVSYFTYQKSPRGVYAYFTTVTRDLTGGGFTSESFMPFDKSNFKILVAPLKRKSAAAIKKAEAVIEAKLDDLYMAYALGRYDEVDRIVKEGIDA